MNEQPEEHQDEAPIGLVEVPKRNINWMAGVPMVAPLSRLELPYSVVDVRNASPDVRHIVIDRHQQPHELFPGQSEKGIEMLNSELEEFARLRTERWRDGRLLPPHPLVFTGGPQPKQPDSKKKR